MHCPYYGSVVLSPSKKRSPKAWCFHSNASQLVWYSWNATHYFSLSKQGEWNLYQKVSTLVWTIEVGMTCQAKASVLRPKLHKILEHLEHNLSFICEQIDDKILTSACLCTPYLSLSDKLIWIAVLGLTLCHSIALSLWCDIELWGVVSG